MFLDGCFCGVCSRFFVDVMDCLVICVGGSECSVSMMLLMIERLFICIDI